MTSEKNNTKKKKSIIKKPSTKNSPPKKPNIKKSIPKKQSSLQKKTTTKSASSTKNSPPKKPNIKKSIPKKQPSLQKKNTPKRASSTKKSPPKKPNSKKSHKKVSNKKPAKKDLAKIDFNERISTNIPNLDKLLKGGFIKNATNLLVGGSGSGKTIFAIQFLVEAMKKGEPCLFITFEEKKDHFYKNMLTFGWDLAKFEKQGKFFFLEYTPEKVKIMLEEGGGAIENIVLSKKISRIVIDSITSFALLFKDELEKRESSLELFSLLRKWDCTALLTYEEEPSAYSNTAKALEFESDSIIHLYFVRNKKSRKRFIEIIKVRGTDHSKEVHPLTIEKKGISISLKIAKKFNDKVF